QWLALRQTETKVGSFPISLIHPLSRILGGEVNHANFQRHLSEFVSDDRGRYLYVAVQATAQILILRSHDAAIHIDARRSRRTNPRVLVFLRVTTPSRRCSLF